MSRTALGNTSITEKVGSTVQEPRNGFHTMQDGYGPDEQSCRCLTSSLDETCNSDHHSEHSCGDSTSVDQFEGCNSEEIKMCNDFSQSLSLNERKQKGSKKGVASPCSERVQSHSSSKKKEGCAASAKGAQNSSKSESLVSARGTSNPSSMRRRSALKGGRSQKGQARKLNLHVKWAPEVYDPPATSVSHTVNNSQHPKSKVNQKHKKNKGRK